MRAIGIEEAVGDERDRDELCPAARVEVAVDCHCVLSGDPPISDPVPGCPGQQLVWLMIVACLPARLQDVEVECRGLEAAAGSVLTDEVASDFLPWRLVL
jgi:hypothetical protein